ncbi:MAG: vWA domain-containing protein [Fuerstiella sp.]
MNWFQSPLDTTTDLRCLVALAVWVFLAWLHRVLSRRRNRIPGFGIGSNKAAQIALVVPRVAVAFAGWLMLLRMTDGLITTSAFLPYWMIGLAAAIVTEVVLGCYAAEQTLNKQGGRRGQIMAFLMPLPRMAAIGLLAIQMLQPTRSHEEETREERTIAVVMDTSASMDLPARIAPDDSRTRRQIADELLAKAAGGDTLLAKLEQRYNVKLYQMNATARLTPKRDVSDTDTGKPDPVADQSAQFAQSTNFSAAFRRINGDIATSSLSGVVLLTDGCDHSDVDVHDSAGFLESNDIPLNSIMIGSNEPVRDAEVVALQTPSQIYHGDELTLQAIVRADQFQNQMATVRLMEGGEVVEERELQFTSDRHRETVRFRYEPREARLHNFTAELSGLRDDEIPDNNVAHSQVWVSKDRIRVLIVEDRPRWEFRYLRNLFAGRDKSVFLQAALLQPDRLAGVPAPMVRQASALRAFDDCNANALPAHEAEWLKFDVIVLGDVDPVRLGADAISALETFVQDHGGSLVILSGPNHMPHSYSNTSLRDLLPAKLTKQTLIPTINAATSVRFQPTAEGLNHVVLQRAGMNTEQAGKSFPSLSWRHPASEAKIGATVLAYAAEQNTAVNTAPNLTANRKQQRQRALMLWHRVGAGKVLQMNFDESWRLRYGIGDRLHHQFWGQIVRWCASDRLSVGTDLVRMGTDKLIYRFAETIKVKARLLDAQRNAVVDGDVRAVLLQDDEVVQSVELSPDPAKAGLLTGEFRDLKDGGAYRVELAGNQVEQLLKLDSPEAESIGLDIGVKAITTGNEALDVVADDTVLKQLAGWTDGIVTTPEDTDRILESLGPESFFQRRRWTTPLWNKWPIILTFLSCLSFEWILRKINGRV